MVIVQINQTYKIGSTGKIMNDLNTIIIESGHESYMVAGYSNDHSTPNLYCANKGNAYFPNRKDQIIFRLTGINGYRYKKRTKDIIDWIDNKHPDVIHLHNIHGDWIHLETLFDYIIRKKIPVVWTLHDCWAFTGRCSYFEMCGCDKWKKECYDCPKTNKSVYPITYFFDHSQRMYNDKKRWFTGIQNMTIVTPSQWLANYVKQSFLGEYPVQVIHNGIDTKVFSPQSHVSKYYKNINNKKIILGVASSWSARKGLDDFVKLDKLIDHSKYRIVLVGLSNKQLKSIPKTIMGITRTNNQNELAELYSGASVFVNPTYQDNYPTTNLEAISCGTPVITYNTGGSPESILESRNIIEIGDVDGLFHRIDQICKQRNSQIIFWNNKMFDKSECFSNYIKLFETIIYGEK